MYGVVVVEDGVGNVCAGLAEGFCQGGAGFI